MQHHYSTDGVVEPFDFGDPNHITRLVFGLTDFTAPMRQHERFDEDNGLSTRPWATWIVNEWKVTLVGRANEPDQWWRRHEGSSGITHAVGIVRADGQRFHADDAKDVVNAIQLILSFANGSLVGRCLPMGYNSDGELKWLQWSVTHSEGLCSRLTWYDFLLWESLGTLTASLLTQSVDDFRKQVLTRTIRMRVAASYPNPIDAVIPTAISALELAASANNVSPIKFNPKNRDSTADAIRGLLDWLNLLTTIPTEMSKLIDYAKKREHADLPAAVNGVRNRLVHPPKKTSDWPDPYVMIDTWTMAMELIDLSVLRMLDYRGDYGHLHHTDGRFVGDVAPVPWASTPLPAAVP